MRYLNRFVLAALVVVLCGGYAAILHADEPAPPKLLAMLAAEDFWKRQGAESVHPELDFASTLALRRLAQEADSPAARIRATKLMRDMDKLCRISDKIEVEAAQAAISAAFEHLEANLKDAEIGKYAPECGFTHLSVSEGPDGKGAVWVLIETATTPQTFSGGLNIRVDTATWKVTSVKQWGAVRPVPFRARK